MIELSVFGKEFPCVKGGYEVPPAPFVLFGPPHQICQPTTGILEFMF